MLANSANITSRIGSLSNEIQKPGTFRHRLIDFIAEQLPVWRDRANRKPETAETVLTSQVCAHLNSAARLSDGWDLLQFRVEEPDEQKKGRKIDLVPSPAGCEIIIEGRRHIDFDSLLPIECKRLPTPNEKRRDEREYVFCGESTTGGIQRFKAGHHGASHRLGAMIGYVQAETRAAWTERVNGWIDGLAGKEPGWTVNDRLTLEVDDAGGRLAKLRSIHTRQRNLADIELRHLWIQMSA